MAKPTGNFSYDDNFNYIGERWSRIDGTGTKGYEPYYGELGRLPEDVFIYGIWDEAKPIEDLLRRADRLVFLAGQVTDEPRYCRRIDLLHNFLLRGTRAVESFVDLILAGDVMNAWALARVLIERCIWLGYILKADKVEEFYEYSALEMKKWAYKAASLGILDLEAVEDFDEEMEDELGHRLGKPLPQWDRIGIEEMCKRAFDKPTSDRIYNLYQLASMSTHPGMDDSGEYFRVASVIDLDRQVGDPGPRKELLQMITEMFTILVTLTEPPLTQAAAQVYGEEYTNFFMELQIEPRKIHDMLRDTRLSMDADTPLD